MSFFGLPDREDADKEKYKAYEFDETYNDLDTAALDDSDDQLNDETFGGDLNIGKDFDFAGTTAQVAPVIGEEQYLYDRQPHAYEEEIAEPKIEEASLQPIASLWGDATSSQPATASQPESQPKVLSLEEVEAQMRNRQTQPAMGFPQHPLGFQNFQAPFGFMPGMPGIPQGMPGMRGFPHGMPGIPQGIPQMPQGISGMPGMPQGIPQGIPQGMPQGIPQGIPQGVPQGFPQGVPQGFPPGVPQDIQKEQPQAIPQSQSLPGAALSGQTATGKSGASETPSSAGTTKPPYQLGGNTHANPVSLEDLMKQDQQLSDRENGKFLEKTRKAAQQIRYNNLMSQWDRNFVMKIQLQQIVSDDPYNEDFYFQVHNAIKARSDPREELSAFAKTYLLHNRGNGRNRRHNENPLQYMQQQVQQAVERAKERPKRKDFKAADGVLGKVSVGSGKQPRRALSLNREQPTDALSGVIITSSNDLLPPTTLRGILANIEEMYALLLELEGGERSRPSDEQEIAKWEQHMNALVDKVWNLLHVTSPAEEGVKHPFLAILEHEKGKKLIPRLFRHLNQKQRLTILTRVVAHLDSLDVIANGDCTQIKARDRESVELFSQTVLPPLVHLISESSFDVVSGLLEIILQTSNIQALIKTKVGLAFLTVLASRAELIQQEQAQPNEEMYESWQQIFKLLFSKVQGHLGEIFPPRNVDDSYVWHFLAALAVTAKLELQRVLVDEVREKIFSTMAEAKALPAELGAVKIGNLNLFLNVMGLNATPTAIGELQEE